MANTNWKTQIRKGYLELCILTLIECRRSLYGLEIIALLQESNLDVKEGTLYPLLARMAKDNMLATHWQTEGPKGHPRKFYSLTSEGKNTLQQMKTEFQEMNDTLIKLEKGDSSHANAQRA